MDEKDKEDYLRFEATYFPEHPQRDRDSPLSGCHLQWKVLGVLLAVVY